MTQAGWVPQSTGRKLKGLPAAAQDFPWLTLPSMNPTKNPRKIKPSHHPAKLSMQPHLPLKKLHTIQFKTPNATLCALVSHNLSLQGSTAQGTEPISYLLQLGYTTKPLHKPARTESCRYFMSLGEIFLFFFFPLL